MEIKMGIYKDAVFKSFSIPMIVNDTAKINKLNKMSVIKNIYNVSHGSVHIIPSSDFLIVKNNMSIKFNGIDLIECITDENFTLCPKSQFIFKNQKSCERDFIMNETVIDCNICNIEYKSLSLAIIALSLICCLPQTQLHM